MSLDRPRYRVFYKQPTDDETAEPREAEVTITYADQLRGELEAGKQSLPQITGATAQNHTTVWVWCALTRLGLYAGDCRAFRLSDCLDVQGLEAEAVDPTPPAAPTPSG